jgi:D-amino peptidase
MKLFISFDIEGVTGVSNRFDIEENSQKFGITQRLATGDINAAVEGALEAGVHEVVVYDGHGFKRDNILFESLNPNAKLIRSRLETPGFNLPTLDESFDALFFIGWHASPSKPGILSHCYHPNVFLEWRVNGMPVGEPELSAAFAGLFNVPVVLFTGDDKSCDEIKIWNPDCIRVITKYAIDREAAICIPMLESWEKIRKGASEAIKNIGQVKPYSFKMPVTIEADTIFDHHAFAISLIPGVKRISDRTISFTSHDYHEAFNTLLAITIISIQAE